MSHRTEYKKVTVCYNVVLGSPPPHLADLQLYTLSRSLAHLQITYFSHSNQSEKLGQHAFSYIGPVTWNRLPFSVHHAQVELNFKTPLKTHLFSVTVSVLRCSRPSCVQIPVHQYVCVCVCVCGGGGGGGGGGGRIIWILDVYPPPPSDLDCMCIISPPPPPPPPPQPSCVCSALISCWVT